MTARTPISGLSVVRPFYVLFAVVNVLGLAVWLLSSTLQVPQRVFRRDHREKALAVWGL